MRPACCHSRRLSESRMRENLTYGLMRGRRKRAVGLLDRDTHPKGEKRPGVAGPATVPRHCPTLRLLNVLVPVRRVGFRTKCTPRKSKPPSASTIRVFSGESCNFKRLVIAARLGRYATAGRPRVKTTKSSAYRISLV